MNLDCVAKKKFTLANPTIGLPDTTRHAFNNRCGELSVTTFQRDVKWGLTVLDKNRVFQQLQFLHAKCRNIEETST